MRGTGRSRVNGSRGDGRSLILWQLWRTC
jgi:hypothetical protein